MIRRRTITSYVWNSVSGNKMVILSNCIRNFFRKFELIGNSVQGENPAPDNPQEIKSAGKWNKEKQKYEIDVKVTGKNFAFGKLYYCSYSRAIGCTNNLEEATLPFRPKSETQGVGYVVPCKKGVTYTFSVTNPNENLCTGITEYTDLNSTINIEKKVGNTLKNKDNLTYTAIGNGVLLCFVAGVWTDGTTTLHECTESELLQVEIGNIPTEYESYTEQSVQIALDEPLRGIGDYKDTITKDGVVRKIKRTVFDGGESWAIHKEKETTVSFWTNSFKFLFPTHNMMFVDKFTYVTSGMNKEDVSWSVYGSGFYININKDVASNLETFKTWLSQNPITVEYIAIEPTTEPLPESVQAQLQALQSENGTTHVFVDSGEVEAGINIEYKYKS